MGIVKKAALYTVMVPALIVGGVAVGGEGMHHYAAVKSEAAHSSVIGRTTRSALETALGAVVGGIGGSGLAFGFIGWKLRGRKDKGATEKDGIA